MMWITCTPEQESAINALLPSHIRVRAISGKLGADILDDCGPGEIYEAAAAIIQSLPVAPES